MSPIHHPGRGKDRAEKRLRFATFRLKCFVWTEQPEAGPFNGFGFAADISETGIGLYLGVKLAPSANVRVAFESESATPYRGAVIWCQRYSLEQHFMGHPALDHRLGLRLLFGSEAERQRYLEYFRQISARVTVFIGDQNK